MYIRKIYYNYVLAIVFKILQGDVLKKNCKVSMMLAVEYFLQPELNIFRVLYVIKSFYFKVLFYRKLRPICWA